MPRTRDRREGPLARDLYGSHVHLRPLFEDLGGGLRHEPVQVVTVGPGVRDGSLDSLSPGTARHVPFASDVRVSSEIHTCAS